MVDTAEFRSPNVQPIVRGQRGSDTATLSNASSRRRISTDIVSFGELASSDLLRWEAIRSSRKEFATPFFSVRYSAAVDKVRGDVEVAVIKSGAETIGFLPFHRIQNVAYPVGRCFNDAHNIIAETNDAVDWIWLLDELGVKAFDFHAMVGSDAKQLDEKYVMGTVQSFAADLGDDSLAFLRRLGKQHKTIGRQPQKTRKMEREIGKVELELDCRDPDVLMQTIQWKRDQYQRTNILDYFTPEWTRDLLFDLHSAKSDLPGQARGLLSVIRSNGQVVASHYGIIENGLLHYWFPAYNTEYSRYSPGTALFTSIVAQATDHGIHCIDMGYGEQPYKLKQTDTTSQVAHGCISPSAFYRTWRTLENAAINSFKRVPMKEPLKQIWRRIQPNAGISKLG